MFKNMICRTDDLDNMELQGGKYDAGESEKSLERFYSGEGRIGQTNNPRPLFLP